MLVVLISIGARNEEPIADANPPVMLTSALVVASSSVVETRATIALTLGVTSWERALVRNISNISVPTPVPRKDGIRKHSAACITNAISIAVRWDSRSASTPAWTAKSRAARNWAELTSEIWNWLAPERARYVMAP